MATITIIFTDNKNGKTVDINITPPLKTLQNRTSYTPAELLALGAFEGAMKTHHMIREGEFEGEDD